MSLKANHRAGICAGRIAAVLAASVGFSAIAHAGGHGEKIEFSEPSMPITTTASNLTEKVSPGLNRLNPAPSAFKQVQEDLFRPLANSMSAVDSMQGVMTLPAPPPPRPIPTKRARELMDQKRNWAFTDLNDLYPEETPEEALGVKNDNTNFTSLIEKYYNRLGQKNGTNRYDSTDINVNPYSYSGTNGLVTQPFAREVDPTRNLFAPRGVSDDGDNDIAPGLKNPYVTPVSGDELQAAQKRTEEFRRLLEHDTSPAPLEKLSGNNPDAFGLHAPTLAGQNAGQPFQTPPETHRSGLSPVFNPADPTIAALHNRATDDPTAFALGLPNPLLQQPVTPPPTPAQISKRTFDPFGAALQKPKF